MSSTSSPELGSNGLSYRIVSTLATLLGTCIVSFCLGQRTYTFDIFSRRGLSSMTVSRFWLLFLMIDSLFFLIGSAVLLQDVGLRRNVEACTLAESFCISFYFISKGAAYFLFLEKVYAVWPNRGTRMTSTAYKVGLVALICFLCLLVVCIIGREAYIRDDGECMIGTHNSVTLTVLLVDLTVNGLLTGLFLVPLLRQSKLSPQVRKVAVRNLIASTCCFISSLVNMAVITALQGHEVAWVCVAACSADICVNAVIAFWVTRPPTQSEAGTSNVDVSAWRAATRNMDADETILTRFERKSSLRVDATISNARRRSKSLVLEESDSCSVHGAYTDSDTNSLAIVAFPPPSRAKDGSTAYLLSPLSPRSPLPTATTTPRPLAFASAPNTPNSEYARQFSLPVPRRRDGAYRSLDGSLSVEPSDCVQEPQSEPTGHDVEQVPENGAIRQAQARETVSSQQGIDGLAKDDGHKAPSLSHCESSLKR